MLITLRRWNILRKIVSSLIIVLLFLASFAYAFTVQTARAQPVTVYINPDGSITPSTANIFTHDNVTYFFRGDVFGGLDIQRSNIIINGSNRFTVRPSGYVSGWSTSVLLSQVSNVTIEYLGVETVSAGIYVTGSSGIRLFRDYITTNESGTQPSLFGIILSNSSNNSVYDNVITLGVNATPGPENGMGISILLSSTHNNISTNIIDKTFEAISIQDSAWNNISENSLGGDYYGVGLVDANNNTISENLISSGKTGIYLERCSDTVVSRNNVTYSSERGIVLYPGAFRNTISDNLVEHNYNGIMLWQASNNTIYHNTLSENSQQVNILESGYNNSWDDGYGYHAGGNYWSDYNGIDLYRGPYQNISGSDGIGDTPYVLGSGNVDRYPLLPAEKMRDLMIEKYNQLSSLYRNLNSTYIDLQSKQQATVNELNWTRNLTYVFILTTIASIASAIYFAIRKTKANATSKTV